MTTLSKDELNRRIQAYLRAHALRMADHERIGLFLASFDGRDDNPYRNYAVPDDGANPEAADIEALIDAFERRARLPRLEYVDAAAPDVEQVLLRHGFEVENRFPLLVCTPDMLRAMSVENVDIETARDERDIIAAAEALDEAYETRSHPEPLIRLVAQGGVLMVARDPQSRRVVGGGMATPAHDGTSEVAGIGVRPALRNRGIAGALTAAITREAFTRGVALAWLTPGHDGAERIYARAGFVRATEQLHISRRART